MGKIVAPLMLGYLLVFSSMTYASSLVAKLNKISLEVDEAEIYAANCAIEAKESKKINDGCTLANDLLASLKQKLELLIAKNVERADEKEAAKGISAIKAKLENANNHLTDAKIITGDYQWTSSVIPSIPKK